MIRQTLETLVVFLIDYTGNPCDNKQILQQACSPPPKQRTQFIKYKEKTQDSRYKKDSVSRSNLALQSSKVHNTLEKE